jgi:hypothetical protein
MPQTESFDLARAEVLETLASYGARTRQEMINAARIIAFSFTSLEVLAEAKADVETPYELRMRLRVCANSLDRSCQQIETRLTKSLASDPPGQPEEVAELPDDMPQSVFEAALQKAQAKIETDPNRLAAAHPANLPQAAFASQHHPAKQPWVAATTQNEQPLSKAGRWENLLMRPVHTAATRSGTP